VGIIRHRDHGDPVVVVQMPGEGGPTPPPVATEPEKRFHYETPGAKVATVVVLGIGAAGLLAAGIGLEVASSNASSTASTDTKALQKGGGSTSVCFRSSSAQCTNLASENSSHASDGNAALGLFIGSGVLVAAALVTSQVWPKRQVEDAHIVPLVSPQMGGLGLVGSF
jgi:hypothetical protein